MGQDQSIFLTSVVNTKHFYLSIFGYSTNTDVIYSLLSLSLSLSFSSPPPSSPPFSTLLHPQVRSLMEDSWVGRVLNDVPLKK